MMLSNRSSAEGNHTGVSKSFTLIELITIIVIIGIIAAVAVPRFINMRADAIAGVEEGTVGAVRSGIKIYGATSAIHNNDTLYPVTLDNATIAAASGNNIFFNTVLSQPVYDSWRKATDTMYQGPTHTYYIYDSNNGTFGAYVANMTIGADNSTYSFLPAVTVNSINSAEWASSGTGLYSPWAGEPLDFSMSFQQAGNYTFSLDAINNADHPGWDSRSGWTLPAGYTQFDVTIKIDGVALPSDVYIPASDTTVQTGKITVPVTAGNHTVTIVWNNDEWDPNLNYDANIQLNNVQVQRAT
jgi:type II secretory pathway pseudopilin PulG